MHDTIISDAPPEAITPPSGSTQNGLIETVNIPWSRDECLYIQLQAELAFAVSNLPVASALGSADSSYYLNFCGFFERLQNATPEFDSERTAVTTQKSQDEYLLKQEELVLPVLWKTRRLRLNAFKDPEFDWKQWCIVTPEVFDEYRKIRREVVGYDTLVKDPRDHSEMWSFLDRLVREKYPESCVPEATETNDLALTTTTHPVMKTIEDPSHVSGTKIASKPARKPNQLTQSKAAETTDMVNQSGKEATATEKDNTKPEAGTKRPRPTRPVRLTRHTRQTTLSSDKDGSEHEDDEEDEEPPPKRPRKPKTPNSGTKGGRNKNDPWRLREREIAVEVMNKYISEHGTVDFHASFGTIIYDIRDQVNNHRSQYPHLYPGVPREVDAVRSQIDKKPVFGYYKKRAKALGLRMKNGEKVEDKELKPDNLFKVADIEPSKEKKK